MRHQQISLIDFSKTPTDYAKGDSDVDRTDFHENLGDHLFDHTFSSDLNRPVDEPEGGREAAGAGPQSGS
jgi:hypothetical protein